VSGRLRVVWERLWFEPASPLGPIAVRTILAGHALWLLLSRPDLPEVPGWPAEFWRGVDPLMPLRFGIGLFPVAVERVLFAALHGTLVAALLGVAPRLACGLSGALLYHFAPMEEILVGLLYTSFGGLTLATLGLFVLAFAPAPRAGGAPSPEHRWPLSMIRMLLALNYFLPGLLKLRYAGLGWFTAENVRGWILLNYPVTGAPWALALAGSTAACWAVALGTLALELGFPLVLVSRRAARVLVPLALAFHAGIVWSLGYAFPALPLLLVYVDWDAVAGLARRWLSGGRVAPASGPPARAGR
jgi:hypothetical protein